MTIHAKLGGAVASALPVVTIIGVAVVESEMGRFEPAVAVGRVADMIAGAGRMEDSQSYN